MFSEIDGFPQIYIALIVQVILCIPIFHFQKSQKLLEILQLFLSAHPHIQ